MDVNNALQWLTAIGAVVAAGAAWAQASRAKQTADESDTTAREANNLSAASNEIARQANQVVDRIDNRQIERNDVRWAMDLRDNDHLIVTNLGVDTALDVIAYGDVNELSFRSESMDVEGRGEVDTDLQGAITAEAAKHSADIQRFNQGGGVFWINTGHSVKATVRVLWRTPLGVWRSEDLDQTWRL